MLDLQDTTHASLQSSLHVYALLWMNCLIIRPLQLFEDSNIFDICTSPFMQRLQHRQSSLLQYLASETKQRFDHRDIDGRDLPLELE